MLFSSQNKAELRETVGGNGASKKSKLRKVWGTMIKMPGIEQVQQWC